MTAKKLDDIRVDYINTTETKRAFLQQKKTDLDRNKAENCIYSTYFFQHGNLSRVWRVQTSWQIFSRELAAINNPSQLIARWWEIWWKAAQVDNEAVDGECSAKLSRVLRTMPAKLCGPLQAFVFQHHSQKKENWLHTNWTVHGHLSLRIPCSEWKLHLCVLAVSVVTCANSSKETKVTFGWLLLMLDYFLISSCLLKNVSVNTCIDLSGAQSNMSWEQTRFIYRRVSFLVTLLFKYFDTSAEQCRNLNPISEPSV